MNRFSTLDYIERHLDEVRALPDFNAFIVDLATTLVSKYTDFKQYRPESLDFFKSIRRAFDSQSVVGKVVIAAVSCFLHIELALISTNAVCSDEVYIDKIVHCDRIKLHVKRARVYAKRVKKYSQIYVGIRRTVR